MGALRVAGLFFDCIYSPALLQPWLSEKHLEKEMWKANNRKINQNGLLSRKYREDMWKTFKKKTCVDSFSISMSTLRVAYQEREIKLLRVTQRKLSVR